MARELALLYKYASLFRELINSKVRNSNASIKKLLRLNSESDWDFLTAAMDIVDDASSAISHVQEFGLGGPTKYDDIGEKYLRLYGLLSATYIQQQAILTIYRIMNVPNVKAAFHRFEGLDIRSLRHKLSSHGTDYQNRATGKKEAYVPLRLDLGDTNVTSVNHAGSSEHQRVDLTNAIQEHIEVAIDILDGVVAKSIGTILKVKKDKKLFLDKLSDLRIEKAGGLVFKSDSGPKLIVTFVGSDPK
jgi:uncharacterized protein YutE (UPF0331/DUF86 family)